MQHITGISRHQLRFSSLEDAIAPDNQVRFIDVFVALTLSNPFEWFVLKNQTETTPKKKRTVNPLAIRSPNFTIAP
jgi:hypothetical protein